jgi:EVE domain
MTTIDEQGKNVERNYWIIVGSPENFRRTADRGFGVQGIKSRHRKKAERMSPGDKLVYYLTGLKAFAGIATVQSHSFESHERIWESGDPTKAAEDYPFRVRISPDLILDEDDFLPAEDVARRMAYVARYPPENWTLAFQGNVHAIDEADYRLIRDALEARVPVGAGAADGRLGR